MRMSHLLVIALAMFLVAGCSKNQVKQPLPTEQLQFVAADADSSTTDDELREVMLALQRVHFAFDSTELTAGSKAALEEAASKLAPKDSVHLYVEGHADELGDTAYNVSLGEQRAKVVQDYLTRLGVPAQRLHVMSYGEEKPLAVGHDELAHAKNRRVDFKLMRGDIELVLEESEVVAR